jgi:hypothetical protein
MNTDQKKITRVFSFYIICVHLWFHFFVVAKKKGEPLGSPPYGVRLFARL